MWLGPYAAQDERHIGGLERRQAGIESGILKVGTCKDAAVRDLDRGAAPSFGIRRVGGVGGGERGGFESPDLFLNEAVSGSSQHPAGDTEIGRAEGPGQEIRDPGRRLACQDDLETVRARQLVQELAAIATGGRRDGEPDKAGLAMRSGVGDHRLLRMDRFAERGAFEFEIGSDVEHAGFALTDCAHLEAGDARPRPFRREPDEGEHRIADIAVAGER